MTVVRGAAARRLAVRTHALHQLPPQPWPALRADDLPADDPDLARPAPVPHP